MRGLRVAAAGIVLALAAGAGIPALAASKSTHRAPPTMQTGFLDRSVTLDGVAYRYQVFVPVDYTPDHAWPVVLFLHGSGERGDDGLHQTAVGLPAAIRNDRTRFPMIVVMPQLRANMRWHAAMDAMAMKTLDAAMAEFHGDPRRVYLTGLSIGGQGAWLLAAAHPDRFAAIAPICGFLRLKDDDDVPDPADDALLTREFPEALAADPSAAFARRIGKLPVWIFHGALDDAVPVANARRMDVAMRAQGGEVRYSEYPDANHNAWDHAYSEPDLVPWLLSHRQLDAAR